MTVRAALGLLGFVLSIAVMLYVRMWPPADSLPAAITLWLGVWAWNIWFFISRSRWEKPGAVIVLCGAAMNTMAVFANGGRMPVAGATKVDTWWQPVNDGTRLLPLCDIYAGFSLGDFFVIGGIVMGLVGWFIVMERRGMSDDAPTRDVASGSRN